MIKYSFQEVMKQAKRMCCYPEYRSCVGCRLVSEQICGRVPQDLTNEDFSTFERAVMDWAAAHPEPQFPTWRDWLETQYYQTRKSVDCGHESFISWLNDTHIPADIAEKLGIEPIKEVEG